MNDDRRFPSIAAMEAVAHRRTPRFAYDYFVGGIGAEACLTRNRQALDGVKLRPTYIDGADTQDLSCQLLGRTYDAPFGVAPIGLGGLIWPQAAESLAGAARRHNLPFVLSSFATTGLERIAAIAGQHAWFQLYLPNDQEVETDLLRRAQAAGFTTLVVTVDIPTETPRERDIRNGLTVPPKFDARTLMQIMARPSWAWQTLRSGVPSFEILLPYVPAGADLDQAARFLTDLVEGHVTREALARIREAWPGKLVVKGILTPEDALACQAVGADGIVVSNHGGRQLDAAPAAVEVLSEIKAAIDGKLALIADGGVRSGLDIARLLACGADFVLLGRAFMYGLVALGSEGGDHAMKILKRELRAAMGQLGCPSIEQLPACLFR